MNFKQIFCLLKIDFIFIKRVSKHIFIFSKVPIIYISCINSENVIKIYQMVQTVKSLNIINWINNNSEK